MNPDHQYELEKFIDMELIMMNGGDPVEEKPSYWAWPMIVGLGDAVMSSNEWTETCNTALMEIKETYKARLIKRLEAELQEGYDYCGNPQGCGRELCLTWADALDWLKNYEG